MEAGCSGSTSDLFEKAKLAVRNVLDPEVPVLTIEEMGILQRIDLRDGIVLVTITPTYVGCPAMHAIKGDIGSSLVDSPSLEANSGLLVVDSGVRAGSIVRVSAADLYGG